MPQVPVWPKQAALDQSPHADCRDAQVSRSFGEFQRAAYLFSRS
jgi:hypothetical protein